MKKSMWMIGFALLAVLLLMVRTAAREEYEEKTKTASLPSVIFEKGDFWIFAGAPKGNVKIRPEREELLKGHLLWVSPRHPLPRDFQAPQVRSVRKTVGNYFDCENSVSLPEEVIGVLCQMQEAGLLEKVRLTEGAVSFYQQEEKRKEALNRYLSVYPWEEAVRQAFDHVPGGGESEHQLGLAVDICLTGAVQVAKKDPLLQSREGEKLMENMADFGFIRRYDPGKKDREEGNCEHLHLRYVGKPHARIMEETGWTLEEYLLFLENQKEVTVKTGEEVFYLCSRPFEGKNGEFFVPCPPCDMSLDNLGNAVIVCKKSS